MSDGYQLEAWVFHRGWGASVFEYIYIYIYQFIYIIYINETVRFGTAELKMLRTVKEGADCFNAVQCRVVRCVYPVRSCFLWYGRTHAVQIAAVSHGLPKG